MPLQFDHKIVDLFSKLICSLAPHPHDLVRVEVWKNDRFEQGENFSAVSPGNITEYVKLFEGKEGHNVFVHLGALRADMSKQRSPAPEDFLEAFGLVVDGAANSIEAAANYGEPKMVFGTADGVDVLFLFDGAKPPAVLKAIGDRLGDLNKRHGGHRKVSTKLPFPGSISWPRKTIFGPTEGDLKMAALGCRTVPQPILIMPTFPAGAAAA